MVETQVTVVGGGIVGCAVADAVARRGLDVVLLEREPALARGTTSRNSEVAHGGMYYPPGTLKAHFCVTGRRLLKDFCAVAGVGYRECGKLIVAVEDAEIPALTDLLERGRENGVEDLELVDTTGVAGLEPEIRAVAALVSPRTGICDAEGVTRALADRAVEHGAQVLTGAPVMGLAPASDGWRVDVGSGDRREGWSHTSGWVVNAAGLFADRVAALADPDAGPRQILVKGNYFAVAPRHAGRVTHLVYPVPPADASSLGVHVCLDLAGQLRLGPDVERLPSDTAPEDVDYGVDPGRAAAFLAGGRRFLPWLAAEDLRPGTCGIRPKLDADGFRDFHVAPAAGLPPGLLHLCGMDSPGLTSAMAVGEHVAHLITAARAA
ncbi:MAG: NAD(P)/FAD-dependent oxidoreductase [bacterium]|nr:NAD(P)/FAD-dependent oxidoreductase [bacterium]